MDSFGYGLGRTSRTPDKSSFKRNTRPGLKAPCYSTQALSEFWRLKAGDCLLLTPSEPVESRGLINSIVVINTARGFLLSSSFSAL